MLSEEVTNEIRRKRITRKLIIIFVGTMVILTFLSKTITNFMLPRVNVERPASGTLIKAISGEGTISAKSVREQYLDKSLIVKEVVVEVGDTVEQGQPIMSLDADDLRTSLLDEQNKYQQQEIALAKLQDRGLLWSYDNNIAAAQENKEMAEAAYYKALRDNADYKSADLIAATRSKDQAERDYNAAIQAKEKFLRDNQRDIKNAQVALEMEARKISSLEQQIEDYGVITAPVSGLITEINFAAGSIANNSKPLFKLAETAQGYKLTVTVDSSQAGYVQAGETVPVSIISQENKQVSGKLARIVDNSQQPGEKKDLIIDVQADGLTDGERGEIYLSKKTKPYQLLVPNTAVHTDQNGSFVLVAKSKDTPLGTETYLQRADVIVDDSDNSVSAIISGITMIDKIVTDSSKPVNDGDKVVVEK